MGFGRSTRLVKDEAERRSRNRLRVRLPSRLETFSRNGDAILHDLSFTGAKIQLEIPVKQHEQCVLHWCGYEALGTVAWERMGFCGIAFERPIAASVLSATWAQNDLDPLSPDFDPLREEARDWVLGVGRS